MENTSLVLALILGAGFLLATLGRLVHLPAVTGYIVAGILLGPLGLDLVNIETIGNRLEHFNQLALMLVAFGIGEHVEFRRMRWKGRLIGAISAFEIAGAALFVTAATFLATSGSVVAGFAEPVSPLVMAILLGAVAVATAPAATLHVVRESQAVGKLSSTLLQVVALNNVAAIVLFKLALSLAHVLTGAEGRYLPSLGGGIAAIPLSLLLGIATGLAIDLIVHRLERRGDMLTAGLALLLLCGEGARTVGLSPLLAGMAAGCTIVNRDHRDVRLFRALNAFEPPIYVLFFTLAGSHLDATGLGVAGLLGFVYFVSRASGKIAGAWVGGLLGRAPLRIRRYLGMCLVPQAGLAIGLLILLQGDESLAAVSQVITPVVLGGILLAELFGPVFIKQAMEKSGEAAGPKAGEQEQRAGWISICDLDGEGACRLVPWTWPRLRARPPEGGAVLVGASHLATVAGLTRMGALLADHLRARLVVGHVLPPDGANPEARGIVTGARSAARELGYPLRTTIVRDDNVKAGLIGSAREEGARIILLGCPLEGSDSGFQLVVDSVAANVRGRVAVVRFAGTLHTERILVPVSEIEDAEALEPVLCALSAVGRHRITVLLLRQAETPRPKLVRAERRLAAWAAERGITSPLNVRAVATEARLQAVLEEAGGHDFIVMAASRAKGLSRYFFGSLATDVARRCRKPMMLVHAPRPDTEQEGNT